MIFFTAIAAILTFFLSAWCWLMTQRPRHWRLWWMSHMGRIDMDSTSEQRRQQDSNFRAGAWAALVLSIAATAGAACWTWQQWRDVHRMRPDYGDVDSYLKEDASMAKREIEDRPSRH